MRKRVGIIKRISCISLVFLLSINSFAAIVSDNDGAAFITKAEFDALKNDFQAQIDNYNTSIDNKIDGAIAAYLAGIQLSNEQEMTLMLWGGTTLGLVEDYRSHPYVEGKVGGRITLSVYAMTRTNWFNGTTLIEGTRPFTESDGYGAVCFHRILNNGSPFKYLVADFGKIGSSDMWDLSGYATVTESLDALSYVRSSSDFTNSGLYTIGYCNGWSSISGTAGTKIKDRSSYDLCSLCETDCRTYAKRATSDDYLHSQSRGGSAGSTHNVFKISNKDVNLSSSYTYDNTMKFITNVAAGGSLVDIFPSEWYGTNYTAGHDTHANLYDLYGSGWTMDESSIATNFHVKWWNQPVASTKCGELYTCDNKAYMRKWSTSSISESSWRQGWISTTWSTSGHYNYDFSNKSRKGLFKSTAPDVTTSNIYSSEIGSAISGKLSAKCSTATINGQSKTVAPLYIGLPLGEVKENDKVKINLDFLDSTSYEVGFYIDGFPSGTLSSSSAANAGCKIDGTTSHIQSVTGPATSKTITLNITKSGILFLKFGATTTSTKGTIKLPSSFTIIRAT